MFCSKCATQNPDDSGFCIKCGNTLALASQSAVGQSIPSYRTTTASQDAINAIKKFAANPVGGLKPAYESFDKKRALEVGIFFLVFYELCILLGMFIVYERYQQAIGSFGNFGNMGDIGSMGLLNLLNPFIIGFGNDKMGNLFKLILGLAVPFVSIAVSSAVARNLFRGEGRMEGDIFIAGSALLPMGFLILLTSILGMANIEVIFILSIFAWCYTILMIYTGCTKISNISDSGSAIAVPLMIMLSAWLTKVVFASLL